MVVWSGGESSENKWKESGNKIKAEAAASAGQ
jgi:hypothetical protein